MDTPLVGNHCNPIVVELGCAHVEITAMERNAKLHFIFGVRYHLPSASWNFKYSVDCTGTFGRISPICSRHFGG